jgi:hypothetical protein
MWRSAQLEAGSTHDRLWNAAQLEMVHTGKMHGFMRMCVCAALRCAALRAHVCVRALRMWKQLLTLCGMPPPADAAPQVLGQEGTRPQPHTHTSNPPCLPAFHPHHYPLHPHTRIHTSTRTSAASHAHSHLPSTQILEWTASPAVALSDAIYLNDRFSLDGRDPNGYVGCMWSIAGIHDMGWAERPVFGKIRYMNYAGWCAECMRVRACECESC